MILCSMRNGQIMTPYFQANGTTIYCGDVLEVLSSIEPIQADTILTDPPYSSGARRDAERSTRGAMLRSVDDSDWFSLDQLTAWGFSWFIRAVLVHAHRHIIEGAHIYSFIDWRQCPNLMAVMESSGLRVNHCLVWIKTQFGMGSCWRNQHENIIFSSLDIPHKMSDRGMGSVLESKPIHVSKRVHPTQKPVDILCRILQGSGATKVLDPFMGGGSTLVAARKSGISSVGIEIREEYCEIAARRVSQELPFPSSENTQMGVEQHEASDTDS